MALVDIKRVDIDAEGGNKFIVVRFSDGNGKTRIAVRGDKYREFHQEIFSTAQNDEAVRNGCTVECLGGGHVKVHPKEKLIFIGGKSTQYEREPDRDATIAMIQEAFPDYTVKVLR